VQTIDGSAKPRRSGKVRPCKGKRNRYRKLISRVEDSIDLNPEAFDPDQVQIPPSLASNEALRTKFFSRLCAHAQQVRDTKRVAFAAPESSAEPEGLLHEAYAPGRRLPRQYLQPQLCHPRIAQPLLLQMHV
jgi:hypothetical protein